MPKMCFDVTRGFLEGGWKGLGLEHRRYCA